MKQCSATTRATAVIVGPVGRDVEVSPASYVVSEDATTLTRLGRTKVRNRSPQAAEDNPHGELDHCGDETVTSVR